VAPSAAPGKGEGRLPASNGWGWYHSSPAPQAGPDESGPEGSPGPGEGNGAGGHPGVD
jgi:hypothetical protein